MEERSEAQTILSLMDRPAFVTVGGIITEANQAALESMVQLGRKVEELLQAGADDLREFREGSICLVLNLLGGSRNAAVKPLADGSLLFVLEDEDDADRFRVLGLAAQHLRQYLSEALNTSEAIQEGWELESETQRRQMAQLNKSHYELLRLIGNMTELGQLQSGAVDRRETTEATSFFSELFQKAELLTEETGKKLEYSLPNKRIFCSLDRNRTERAFYNLVSNAIRFSSPGGAVKVSLSETPRQLVLRVKDSGSGLAREVQDSLFSRYRRSPGIEDGRYGIGLGLQIVRRTAAIHGGTLLICPADGGTLAVLSFEKKLPTEQMLRSPILRVDYAGDRDHGLIELSRELPWKTFENL